MRQDERTVLVVALGGKIAGLAPDSGQILWTNKLEGGGYGHVYLAIDQGRILASADGAALFCLDLSSGATIWKSKTTGEGRAVIVVEPDAIYVAKGGRVDRFAIDGRLLWSQPLEGFGLGGVTLGFPGNVVQSDDPGAR
jgi:outer membrane protein assembly factor BamB